MKTSFPRPTFHHPNTCVIVAFLSVFLASNPLPAAEKSGWDLLPDILARIVPPTFPDRDFLVSDYGALGDGMTDCRSAFQQAIAACTQAGGGRVVVPQGTFFCKGPIHLDHNVNFHVSEGAVIRFSNRFDDYLPHVRVRWEGTECYNYSPLVYAYRKTNIAITGKGTLNGQAEASWATWGGKTRPGTPSNQVLRTMGRTGVPLSERIVYCKPTMIEPFECTNVLIEGVTLNDYPFWCVHPVFSTNVTIRNLRVESHNSNNDGINPDSCRDVLIENNYLDQSDDSLAIKAGRDQDAWKRGRPCENIVIRNMSVFDGVAIGSEMSGGVQNVFVYDCDYQSGNVLYCKSNLDRGGFIRNLFVKNINVGKARVLRLRNNYHGYRGGNYPTDFREIHIENVHIQEGNDETISVTGVEAAPVFNVFVKNVTVERAPPPLLNIRSAENVVLTNVRINGALQPTHPPILPPEAVEPEGTPAITPRRSGLWSDRSLWETGRDSSGADWEAIDANRLPDGASDRRVLIGKSSAVPTGVTVIMDQDIDDAFEVRIYEHSTLIIPWGRRLKIAKDLRPDRQNSMIRQTGGHLEIGADLHLDHETCQYLMTGGSIQANKLSLDEGTLIIDDSRNTIESLRFKGTFRTGDGNGDTTTKFVAHANGLTPIECADIELDSYLGERLIVDVSKYDFRSHGDLVLFRFTGTRKGAFDGGPEDPSARVDIIGAKAHLVYDDDSKQIRLTNFRY